MATFIVTLTMTTRASSPEQARADAAALVERLAATEGRSIAIVDVAWNRGVNPAEWHLPPERLPAAQLLAAQLGTLTPGRAFGLLQNAEADIALVALHILLGNREGRDRFRHLADQRGFHHWLAGHKETLQELQGKNQ